MIDEVLEAPLALGTRSRRPRVDTLIRLRWLAIGGQLAAVLATHYGLGFPLPIRPCLAVISLSIWANLGLRLRSHRSERLSERRATGHMAYDLVQLAALLYLTGGLENPFSTLFLAPLMIAAVSLSAPSATALTGLVILCASFLTVYHFPLPWMPGETIYLPMFYRAGIWGAIVLGASFAAAFTWRISEEGRRLSDALAATELVLAREQHLSQLDGLAAAAAHELGTPLATIKLVARDLTKLFPADGEVGEDLALLMSESERCATILRRLTSLGTGPDDVIGISSLRHLVEEVVQPQRDFGVAITIVEEGAGPEPACARNPGVLYGLGNLLENAVDFAQEEVRVTLRWTASVVAVIVADDGPGFAPGIVMSLGEPYLNGKIDRGRRTDRKAGLGLGLFIAKTLLERAKAGVSMVNATIPDRGARVTVLWQRADFEAGRPGRRSTGEAEETTR